MENYITGLDLALIFIYFFVILGIGYSLSKKLPYKQLSQYFIWGLAIKLLCGLGFGWVYVYYYGGGDTQMYYEGASVVFNEITSGNGFNILWDNFLLGHASKATYFTQRFVGIVNLFAFNSYWACTLLFATLSFIGLWYLFKSFFRIFPSLHKQLAIAILFIPGVVFWSAGIMKDSICMLAVGLVVYAIQNIFLFNHKRIISIVTLVLSFYVLINLKAYIALALVVAVALYSILALKSKIRNRTQKVLVLPIAAVIMLGSAFLLVRYIGESLQRYSLENIMETAESYQNYHARISYAGRGSEVRTGSAYDLGEINFESPGSIASKIPAALNVTFFRPYLWEVKNPVMLLSALESTAILVFTLMVLFRVGLGKFFRLIITQKEILFCLSFALIFGFAVGFTTYNFGSLVRYKTPCIPFFLVALILLNQHAAKKEVVKRKHVRTYYSEPHTT